MSEVPMYRDTAGSKLKSADRVEQRGTHTTLASHLSRVAYSAQ